MSNYIQGTSFYFCTAYSGKTCQLDEGGVWELDFKRKSIIAWRSSAKGQALD